MWYQINNNGNDDVCHPFCNGDCYWPFNWRYCKGTECRATVNGDAITPPTATAGAWDPRDSQVPNPNAPNAPPGYDILRSYPPQCVTDNYPGGRWRHWDRTTFNGDFNNARFAGNLENVNSQIPNTAVPLTKTVPSPETVITAIIPGTNAPPFQPVPHSEIVVKQPVA
jgi:hypothetical protein